MADYSDLVPGNLKPGLTTPDGQDLKPSLVTPLYTGGTPGSPDEIKPSLRNADGGLKAGVVSGEKLKASLGPGAPTVASYITSVGDFDNLGGLLVQGSGGFTVSDSASNTIAALKSSVRTLLAGETYRIRFEVSGDTANFGPDIRYTGANGGAPFYTEASEVFNADHTVGIASGYVSTDGIYDANVTMGTDISEYRFALYRIGSHSGTVFISKLEITPV